MITIELPAPCSECGSTSVHASFEITWGARIEDGQLTMLKPHGPNGLPIHTICPNPECEAERDDVDPGDLWEAIEQANPDLIQGGW